LGPAADYLRKCHTVWVLGNHIELQSGGASGAGASATLKDFADVIIQHCGGESGKQVIIELADRPALNAKRQPSPVQIKELSVHY
jgi:hypothetical protein